MALRDHPYLPLFIKDFVTDEKLIHCSPAAHGIMIRLMCLLHKEETYGKLLLQQKYQQIGSKITIGFALQLAKNFPFDSIDIEAGLDELFAADVIQIRGRVLSQKRMVRDGDISDKRASAGKTGGTKTSEKNKNFATNFATAKTQANTEIENAIDTDSITKDNKGVQGGKKRKAKKGTPPHHFHVSPYYDKTLLTTSLFGTQYQDADIEYYHQSATNWSASKDANKKSDWLATIKNWMLRDISESKFKIKANGTYQQNATGNSHTHPGGAPGGPGKVAPSFIARRNEIHASINGAMRAADDGHI